MPNPSAWRIDKHEWASTSFDGTGAAEEGGRWNSRGVRVVYCSRNLAMAAQEKFVHLPKPLPRSLKFLQFRIEFNGLAIESVKALPKDWQRFPPPKSTQDFGDQWLASARTVILAVPSVLIPEETNYLLNPAHPDFAKLTVSAGERFLFEPRIARLADPA